jgi:hypothetical protein
MIHPKICRSNPRGNIRYHVYVYKRRYTYILGEYDTNIAIKSTETRVSFPARSVRRVSRDRCINNNQYYYYIYINFHPRCSICENRMSSHSTPNIECTIGSWLNEELFGSIIVGSLRVVAGTLLFDCILLVIVVWVGWYNRRLVFLPFHLCHVSLIYIYILVGSSVTTHLSIHDVVYGGIVPHVHVVIRRILWLWLL